MVLSRDNMTINSHQADAAMSLKTWWALVCVYPLARPLTVWIVNHTRITPNQVTVCAIVLRLLTALCFASGTRLGLVLGALAYYFAYVCDCTDGTVARITGQTSELGRYLDHVADLVGDLLILTVLAWTLGMLVAPLVLGLAFMHIAECYISYVSGFAIKAAKGSSTFVLFRWLNRYRRWWFDRNLKSFFSFPDYAALIFVVFPLFGQPVLGLQVGFYVLLVVVCYTILSTFVSIHTGEIRFP